MPKYTPTFMIDDCWSSIGNISFFHRNGQCFWRRKPTPLFPATPAQLQQCNVHHRAILAWQKLSSAEQKQWREYAAVVPAHRPPFLKENHISGYNLFVSAYHGFAQLGNEHVPVPQAYPQFPAMSLTVVDSKMTNENDLEIKCNLNLSEIAAVGRWKLIVRLQLTAPNKGCDPGKMRGFLGQQELIETFETFSKIETKLIIPSFVTVWNLDLPRYQLHYKYQLLDTKTGYRNNANKGSMIATIRE